MLRVPWLSDKDLWLIIQSMKNLLALLVAVHCLLPGSGSKKPVNVRSLVPTSEELVSGRDFTQF